MCYLTLHVSTALRCHLQGTNLCKTAARCYLDSYTVHVINIICINSLTSDDFSCSVYIISDNSIMSEIQVLAGKLERKRTV